MSRAQERIVIDGLVYFCDGDPAPLRSGGVTAANVTVTDMRDGLEPTFDGLAEWLDRLAAPDSPWLLVRTADDIARAKASGRTGLIMGWQNTLAIGQNLRRVRAFHALGMRVMQLTYNEANAAGDGCSEPRNGGLSLFGRDLVGELNRVGVAIDLSHCGDATATEASRLSSRPVLLTHANAKAVDMRPRNKTDDTLKAVAATGGVVGASIHGLMNWDNDPAHPPTLGNFVRHVRHIANLVGVEHVGVGTDFAVVSDDEKVRHILDMTANRYSSATGSYVAAFGNTLAGRFPTETPSAHHWQRIVEALEQGGFAASEVDRIVGGNLLRAFGEIWG
ncbi:membrane dipeptidase [Burkholderiales bacterium]|nr:membrane dipeptidase [Burkholderiales bacterium]